MPKSAIENIEKSYCLLYIFSFDYALLTKFDEILSLILSSLRFKLTNSLKKTQAGVLGLIGQWAYPRSNPWKGMEKR